MSRIGFDITVISPNGDNFRRKSFDETPGTGQYVRNYIPFEFEFDETMRPNFGRVTLHNLTNQQRKPFERAERFGLKVNTLPEASNNIFETNFDIIKVETSLREEGETHDTDIFFRDTPIGYHQDIIADKWSKGTPAKTVLREMLSGLDSVKTGPFNCSSSKKYRRGKSFYLPAFQAIKQVAGDLGVKVFFFNKKYYVVDADESVPGSTASVKEKDLIKKVFDKGSDRKEALMQFESEVKPGHDLQVNTEDVSGKFRVYSGKHTSRQGKSLYSEVKLK